MFKDSNEDIWGSPIKMTNYTDESVVSFDAVLAGNKAILHVLTVKSKSSDDVVQSLNDEYTYTLHTEVIELSTDKSYTVTNVSCDYDLISSESAARERLTVEICNSGHTPLFLNDIDVTFGEFDNLHLLSFRDKSGNVIGDTLQPGASAYFDIVFEAGESGTECYKLKIGNEGGVR